MRVAYVLKRYPRFSETFVVNEILAHEAAGLEIEIFALRPPSDTHFQDGISRVRASVTYLPNDAVTSEELWQEIRDACDGLECSIDLDEVLKEDSFVVRQALLLVREVIARGIGHMHAHFGTVATSVVRLVSRWSGVPYSFTAHAKDIFHESVDPGDLGRKLRDARFVVTVSDFNRAFLAENHPDSVRRVHRIYNGLDLDRFSYSEPADRGPRILAVGRLVEKKGFDILIDACAELDARGRVFECRILGEGELGQDLRSQIRRRGVSHRVEMAGPKPQSCVIQEVRDAAALVAPCVVGRDGNRDGLPTTILEAMALGTPCIATDVTGIPEAIRDGETGIIVPQHDPVRLANAIETLLDDREARVRLSAGARQHVEREFDQHRNAGRLRRLFSAVMSEDTAAPELEG